MIKQRILYIDQLRGISILLVVIGHFIQYNTIDSTDNNLFNLIYSFHMPLFMFISGYVAYLTISKDIFNKYLSFVLKKARTLLIPFFAWPLIVNPLFFNNNFEFNLLSEFKVLMNDPRTGLWFLWYVFFLTILYSFFLLMSSYWNAKKNFIIDVVFFIVVLSILVFLRVLHLAIYIDSFIQYFGYFFIGIFVAKYAWLKSKILDVKYFSFFLILFCVSVGHYTFNDPGFHNMGLSLLIRIVVAVSAIFSLYYITNHIEWNPVLDRYFTAWGAASLVIYTTHFKFIDIFKSLYVLPVMSSTLLTFISLFFALLIIFLCMFIYQIVKLSPILNLALYGNLAKKKLLKS